MLPTVMLTAEDAIRMVPDKIKDAAVGMGATPAQVIWHVICRPPSRAFSRASCWPWPAPRAKRPRCSSRPCSAIIGRRTTAMSHLMQPTASMAVLIYNFSGSAVREPDPNGMGRGPRAGRAGPDRQPHRPEPLPAIRSRLGVYFMINVAKSPTSANEPRDERHQHAGQRRGD